MITKRTISALLALLAGVLATTCSNRTAASASPPHELRMSANAAADPLIKAAYSRVRNVTIKTTSPGGASIASLNDPQQGVTNIGIALADTTYLAYTGQLDEGGKRYDKLRGMAMLDSTRFISWSGRAAPSRRSGSFAAGESPSVPTTRRPRSSGKRCSS